MTTKELKVVDHRPSGVAQALLLVWQNPDTRLFRRVGRLDHHIDGRYAFAYESDASKIEGFYPLAEFPSFDLSYISDSLPAFFANRVMSQDRPSYSDYRGWLGLEFGSDTPMEVLSRTGGSRATDTFHLVDSPMQGGRFASRFFVSGVSHVDGVQDRISRIDAGDRLELRPQPDNPVNPKALLVDVASGEEIGWIPDWLVDEIHRQINVEAQLEITVDQVNPDAPDHLKVLAYIRVL